MSTILQLKKKIKVLRDSYRLELNKVKHSRKSGAGLDDVYKPKLVWFTVADSFWRNGVSGRESTSNLDISTAEMSNAETQGEVNDKQETIDNTCLDQSHSTPSQDKQLNYSHPLAGTNKRLADRSPPSDHSVTGLKKGQQDQETDSL